MAEKKTRALTEQRELNEEFLTRDTRSPLKKFLDAISIPNNMFVLFCVMAASAYLVAPLSDFIFLLSIPFFIFALTRKDTAPIKLPIQAKLPDPNQLNPGTGKPSSSEGIFFLGNEMKTGKEIWVTNSDARQHFLVVGTTGAGKAQPLDALVHTPTGFKKMGDLQKGEYVSTPDGSVGQILDIYPQGVVDIYTVEFEDGRKTEACGEHLWEIHHKHYKKGVSRIGDAKPKILSTLEVKSQIERNKGDFSTILPEPVEYEKKVFLLDPYVMGAMLGDGNYTTKTIRFNTVDDFILHRIKDKLPENIGLKHYDCNKDCDYSFYLVKDEDKSLSMCQLIKKLGIFGQYSHEKNIPQVYLHGSIEQRWELLRGLFDTNGNVRKNGECYFYSDSETLAKQVQTLVWSLGGIAKIKKKNTSYKDKNSNKKDGRLCHVVNIRVKNPKNVFSLPLKKDATPDDYQYVNSLKCKIKSISFVGKKEAQCIFIDHPEHLYITDNFIVTHNTESLLGFAANAIMWGSGFLFCDGKGDVALFAKVFALARRFGREDDLLVLNFMTGNQDLGAAGGKLMSNTLNPFSTGSSDSLTQMVVSLMDDAGGDGAMWKGRATAMLTGVMRALTWLRDEDQVDLNVGEIREFMQLRKIIDLGDTQKYANLPQPIRKTIKSYLTSLPGFQEEKGYKQAQTTLDQHGYLEMQFTKILGSLADVYGHIFHTPYGEVDMHDVVLNRRILVIMLPALEKSGDEIANLGKIVVATLKGMMGSTLGSSLEGDWAQVVDNRPTNSPSPFICVLDEVGYYTVEGMALMAAQARSLGFTMVYASQDIPAMKRLNEKEAASIIANTNTKIFMRSEEADVTGKLAVDSAGKGLQARVAGYSGEVKDSGTSYRDNMDASIVETERVNFTDLKAQGEGEMHIMFQDKIVRAKSFYANPEGSINKKIVKLRANHFIKVAKPDIEELEKSRKQPEIMNRLLSAEFTSEIKKEAEEAVKTVPQVGTSIALAMQAFDQMLKKGKRNVLESACGAVTAVIHNERELVSDFNDTVQKAVESSVTLIDDESEDVPLKEPVNSDPMLGGLQSEIIDELMRKDVGEDDIDMLQKEESHTSRREKNKSHIKENIPHSVSLDGGEISDMAKEISSNETIMKALAALDFDDEASKEEVDESVNEVIEDRAYLEEEASSSENVAIEDIEDALMDSSENVFDEDGDQDGDVTTDFLSALFLDDDDDD